jgi:carbon-monoxide dehydrogenase iron sulfur subunit
MLKRRILVEPILCIGCLECELVCSITKTGIANPANARIRVTKIEEEGRFEPVVCRQCDPAPCEIACPEKAITRNVETGALLIDDSLCINCGECVDSCPFGAIQFSAERKVILCDLCGGDPKCVKCCPTRPENSSAYMSNPRASALQFLEPSEAMRFRRIMRLRKVFNIDFSHTCFT